MFDALVMAAVSLCWIVVAFVPLERMFAARKQPIFRNNLATDALFFFGQHLVFAAAAATMLATGMGAIAPYMPDVVHVRFAALPLAVQVILVLVLGDLFAYWGHRAQHRFDVLWRFHSVHHTTEELDFMAAHREHPLDGVYTQFFVNIPAFALGFAFEEVMALVVFRSFWAVFIHSNVRIPLGPLRYLVGSPALHHWHHAKERDVGNYANLAPWLDVVFGTYHLPDGEPETLGIPEEHARDYLGLLWHPFKRR